MKHNATMILGLSHIVRKETKHAPSTDQRRRVNYVLASYYGTDPETGAGCEYRKAFRSYGEPVVPASGTHAELNALAEQY